MAGGAFAQTHRVTDLGDLGFQPNVELHGTAGINDLGQVVYGSDDGSGIRAFVWLPENDYGLARGTYDLDAIFGTSPFSIAREINTEGQIAGQVDGIDVGEGEGVVWDLATGGATPLGFLPDGSWSRAMSISEGPVSVVVGESEHLTICPGECEDDEPAKPQLFLNSFRAIYDGGVHTLQPLSPLGCDSSSAARDVEGDVDGSLVVGFSDTIATDAGCDPFTPSCPFEGVDPIQWGTPAALELPGLDAPDNFRDAEARGVDGLGRTVGWGYALEGFCETRAFYWETAASVVDLNDSLPSGHAARAEAINDRKEPQVVGWSWHGTTRHAVLWENQGGAAWAATDLNAVIPVCSQDLELVQAHDVNDAGWIAGWGRLDTPGPGFERHAFVLSPIGENPSDLDGDGIVGIVDFLELLGAWGPWGAGVVCRADVDLDCTVGVTDFLRLLGDWTL
jgi:uncharacterized membrane protein